LSKNSSGSAKHECDYPKCSNEVQFTVRDSLKLCEEHYNLWKFIEELLFQATIEITTNGCLDCGK
jgi:hypothetical protein